MKTPKSPEEIPARRGRAKGRGASAVQTKGKKLKVNLWITEEQDSFLDELKEVTGLDKSEHHRRAIDLYRDYLQSLKRSPEQRRSTDSQFQFLREGNDQS